MLVGQPDRVDPGYRPAMIRPGAAQYRAKTPTEGSREWVR